MNGYVEFHLGRAIALSVLSEMLTEISIPRFSGFVRINEAVRRPCPLRCEER